MRTKIATWLMSMAMLVNGGPMEPMETEPAIAQETVITETILEENIIPETIVVETIVPEEHEGEIFEIEELEKEHNLKETLSATRDKVAYKAVVYWDDVCTTFDNLGDKIIFWD